MTWTILYDDYEKGTVFVTDDPTGEQTPLLTSLTQDEAEAVVRALAAERRVTVERIEQRLMASRLRRGPDDDGGFWPYSTVRAILDEEAAVWLTDPPTWEFGDDPDAHETCGYVWEVHDTKLLPPDGVATPFGCPWSEQEAIERWGPR